MNPDYKSIFFANGQLEAKMIKIFLEADGIPVQLSQESAGIAMGLTIGRLGIVEILVPEEKEAEARTLIASMETGELESNDALTSLDQEE